MFFKFISKNANVTWVIILHASVITAILKKIQIIPCLFLQKIMVLFFSKTLYFLEIN